MEQEENGICCCKASPSTLPTTKLFSHQERFYTVSVTEEGTTTFWLFRGDKCLGHLERITDDSATLTYVTANRYLNGTKTKCFMTDMFKNAFEYKHA